MLSFMIAAHSLQRIHQRLSFFLFNPQLVSSVRAILHSRRINRWSNSIHKIPSPLLHSIAGIWDCSHFRHLYGLTPGHNRTPCLTPHKIHNRHSTYNSNSSSSNMKQRNTNKKRHGHHTLVHPSLSLGLRPVPGSFRCRLLDTHCSSHHVRRTHFSCVQELRGANYDREDRSGIWAQESGREFKFTLIFLRLLRPLGLVSGLLSGSFLSPVCMRPPKLRRFVCSACIGGLVR